MKSSVLKLSGLLFFICVMTMTTSAALVLTVDSTLETIAFSGDASGTSTTLIVWGNADILGAAEVDVATGLNITGESSPVSTAVLAVSETEARLTIASTNLATIDTIQGTGATISYASLSSTQKSFLQGLNALTLVNGVLWDDVTVSQVSAIPESSAISWLIGLLIFTPILMRRRH